MRTVTFCLLSGFSLLFLGGCNEAVVEVGEPAIEVAPLYAIFPQYVADVRNFADSVLAQGTSEDVTYSQDLTWTPSFGGSPYEATFYPAQRVVDDTIMVSSLRYWKWRQTSGYGTSFSDIAYPTQYRDSLQLYYRINIIAPVVVGGISGPTNIPYKGTYAWSMSRSGGTSIPHGCMNGGRALTKVPLGRISAQIQPVAR